MAIVITWAVSISLSCSRTYSKTIAKQTLAKIVLLLADRLTHKHIYAVILFMKTQAISKILAICALSCPAAAEEIRVFCAHSERAGLIQEFTLDMEVEEVRHDSYVRSNYVSQILIWDSHLIAWAQIVETSDAIRVIDTFYLSRPFLLLSEYSYTNSQDFGQPIEFNRYRCTRALSDEDQNNLLTKIDEEEVLSEGQRREYMAMWGAQIMARIERERPQINGRGQVTLSLRMGRNGNLIEASIARTSGDIVLDEAALSAVRTANPYPKAPDALRDESYSFSIPIRFR